MNRTLTTILSIATLAGTAAASSPTGFAFSSERLAYTGSLTKYATLADAQAGTNVVAGPTSIPNRGTGDAFDTPNRDLGLFFASNAPSYSNDQAIALTAWYFTTNPNPTGSGVINGWGNPNNSNTGFMQMFDADASSVATQSAAFSNFNGTEYTDFTFNSSITNALGADEFSRLWPAPTIGGAANISGGDFLSLDINIVFSGLNGTEVAPGIIEANVDPTSVSGTITGIFQNTSTADPSQNGFYTIDYTVNLDSWVFGNQASLAPGSIGYEPSFFVTVPTPASAALLGMAGLAAARRRRA